MNRHVVVAMSALAVGMLSAEPASADLGPKPAPNCVKAIVPLPRLPDVAVEPRHYWKCPKKVPMLKATQARSEARKQAVSFAAQLIDEGAYDAGVKSCKRLSRLRFSCRTYLDVEGHIRCGDRWEIHRTADGIEAEHVSRGKITCARSSKARY